MQVLVLRGAGNTLNTLTAGQSDFSESTLRLMRWCSRLSSIGSETFQIIRSCAFKSQNVD